MPNEMLKRQTTFCAQDIAQFALDNVHLQRLQNEKDLHRFQAAVVTFNDGNSTLDRKEIAEVFRLLDIARHEKDQLNRLKQVLEIFTGKRHRYV